MKLSIVIPAHNEEKYLPRCLESLKHQIYKDFEIIVVDNASTDNTSTIAKQFGATVIHESKKGVGAARRAGFAITKGEISITTDADCTFPSDWLEKIAKVFNKNPNTIAIYGISSLDDAGAIKRILSKLGTKIFFAANDLLNKKQFTGCNLAVRKSTYNQTAGFDANIRICEDADLCKKLMRIGKIKFIPSLLVYTSARRFKNTSIKTLLGYIKLYYQTWWATAKPETDAMADMTDIR